MKKAICLKNTPLAEKLGGVYLVRFNLEPQPDRIITGVDGDGNLISFTEESNLLDCLEQEFVGKPDISTIKKLIIDYYNKECDNEILSGLKVDGATVWLSSENQFNYKSAFDFAMQTGGANLPVKFKLGDDDSPVYKEFNRVTDLQQFIITVMTHVTVTLNKYWAIKDSIDWEKYKLD